MTHADWITICAWYKVESFTAAKKAGKLSPEQEQDSLQHWIDTGEDLQ